MEELYVVIANFGRGQQSLWPRMRDSRNIGEPIFGDADPSTSSGIAGLYTKAEADAIVSDNSERGYGAPHYHAKPLATAHEFAQGLAGNLIQRVQQDILKESRMIKMKKSHLAKIIRETFSGYADERPNNPMERAYARAEEEAAADRLVDDAPNPPSAFPIRVGWAGGSYDAVDDEDLEMITRDLVSKGIAYSVDSVSELEPEISVGSSIEQYAEGIESLRAGKIRIKKSKLIDLIREAFEIVNAETGELMPDPESPERMFNTLKRLGITPTEEGMPGAEEVYLSGDDWDKYYDESVGKTRARHKKREFERLDAKNLMKRLDQWAAEAGIDYSADNPGVDMELVARDLAKAAEFEFAKDEWEQLLLHFDIEVDLDDPRTSEEALIDYVADSIASLVSEGKIRVKKSDLSSMIREALLAEAKMQDIITNTYEEVGDYNILANFALTGDIAGALAHPVIKHYVDKNEMGWVADEAGGWFEQVGKATDLPAPKGWDSQKAYKFLRDLEDAAWKVYNKQAKAAIAGDPDKEFLEFLGNEWTSMIEPNDLPDIKWKEYKKYIRLKPPRSISHGVGEINVSKENIKALYPGAYEDFMDFLTTRAGGQLGRRAPYKKSPPPYYD